tara:strand:- start:3913 stop:5220 length:1308 start_codon:yes stop_codon:yes gene_type:complete
LTIDYFLQKFSKLYPKSIDLSLDRIKILLDKLGNPEKKLPPIIHVAGTNGKGSTIAFLKSIFESANYKVQAYTSPHLINFNERIRLPNGFIKDDFLIDIFKECNFYNKNEPISFFEITTAAAFLAFSKSKGDILLLEVGLGGRLDTTNVIEKSILSTITPVSLDHTEFLGQNIDSIAFEKAGIIKDNGRVLIGPQTPRVTEIIKKIANERNNNSFIYGRDWFFNSNSDNSIKLNFKENSLFLPKPRLNGFHQISNAAQAAACTMAQDIFKITESNLEIGILNAYWPGRLQKINVNLPEKKITNLQVWLDGGHNASAGTYLSKSIKSLGIEKTSKIVLILGMLDNKDFVSYLEQFKKIIDLMIFIPVPNSNNYHSPDKLKNFSEMNLRVKAKTAKDFFDALNIIDTMVPLKNTKIITCGSLYLVGEVLKINGYNFK